MESELYPLYSGKVSFDPFPAVTRLLSESVRTTLEQDPLTELLLGSLVKSEQGIQSQGLKR